MAEISLPSSVDFSKRLPYLPDNVNTNLLTVQASNGQSFIAGSVVSFDLPARAGLYIDPKSMFFRYKVAVTCGNSAVVGVRCTPAYSFLQKLDEFLGSQPISSVYNYNQVANLWVNSNLNVADKFGQQTALGFGSTGLSTQDGGVVALNGATTNFSFSAPLICSALSSADHMLPTGLMPPIRVQITLANLNDIQTLNGATAITAYTITNFELCMAGTDFGSSVDAMVASMGSPKLYIKTTGWANQGAQQLPIGAVGSNSLVFNHRYQSIQNAYTLFCGADITVDLNGWGDSRDITSGGSFQLQIGSNCYPLLSMDTANNKSTLIQYLRECTGSIADFKNSMSISAVEFAYVASSATATTITEPAKVYFAVPLSKIQQANPYASGSLMSGVNASSSPILAQVRIGNATTTQAYNPFMIVSYDNILEIDPLTRQVNIIC